MNDAGRSPDRMRRELVARHRAGRRNGARIVADALVRAGITHVFCVGGAPVDVLIGACGEVGLRLIGARHQTGAGLMSAAFNFVSGALRSAVIVSGGPAATNLTTAILVAHDNAWPLLLISGRLAAPGTPGGQLTGAFQRFDAAGFHRPIVRWSGLVTDAPELGRTVAAAAFAATGRPPGPAFVDIAGDTLLQSTLPPRIAGHAAAVSPSCVDARPFQDAARLLGGARRPMMLIGDGLRWSAPWSALRRLVDDNDIVFATAPMARGFLPDDHPRCHTPERARFLATADVVLVAGARLDWSFRHGAEIAPGARLIRLAWDERAHDQGSVTPGLQAATAAAVVLPGDAGEALGRLADALDADRSCHGPPLRIRRSAMPGADTGPAGDHEPGPPSRDPASSAAPPGASASPGGSTSIGRLEPKDWLAEAASVLPRDAITVLDGNVVMTLAQRILPAHSPASRLTPGANGTMGIGVPFAIGAKLARPDLPVIAFTGDFALGTQLAELETAARHRIGIIVVVANNAGAGGTTRQRSVLRTHPEAVLSFSTAVRYDRVADGLGCTGEHVASAGTLPGALLAALERAERDRTPTCIDVGTARDVPVVPSI